MERFPGEMFVEEMLRKYILLLSYIHDSLTINNTHETLLQDFPEIQKHSLKYTVFQSWFHFILLW